MVKVDSVQSFGTAKIQDESWLFAALENAQRRIIDPGRVLVQSRTRPQELNLTFRHFISQGIFCSLSVYQ